ncbi:hypothetical protein [Mycolicibacterium houstonense]|nr:hypothetical protein [Mycolicibacterium houstonense]
MQQANKRLRCGQPSKSDCARGEKRGQSLSQKVLIRILAQRIGGNDRVG